jgi:hypothetical protein
MRSLHSSGTLAGRRRPSAWRCLFRAGRSRFRAKRCVAAALAAGALAGAALLSQSSVAAACVLEPVRLHRSDASLAGIDTRAPDAPLVAAARAYRRSGLTCGEGICVANNCGDMGGVAIDLAAGDDQTPTNRLGYRLELLSGVVPGALQDMLGVALEGPTPLRVQLAFDDVPSVDATLRVIAIDGAGNESAPSEPFHLSFDGCTLAATGDQCEHDFDADAEYTASGGTLVVAGNETAASNEEAAGNAPAGAALPPAFEASAWSSDGQGCNLPAGAPREGSLRWLAPAALLLGWAAARRR